MESAKSCEGGFPNYSHVSMVLKGRVIFVNLICPMPSLDGLNTHRRFFKGCFDGQVMIAPDIHY